MGFQSRQGPLRTGLRAGLLLLFGWMTLAQRTSLSGTALSSVTAPPLRQVLHSFSGVWAPLGSWWGEREPALLKMADLFHSKRWEDHSCPSPAPLPLPSAVANHLCQATWDADGGHYPGFFCPRLSDTPEEAYCCHLQAAGGSCCTRAEFEALYQVNLSTLPSPAIFR